MINQDMLTQFNASLSIIPDNEFFGIIETYIGKVPTPFHKPQLHHALATFFANDDVIQKIIMRIDELDTLIISALFVSESLTEEQLCIMFKETHLYTSVMARVINLEERLIFLPNPQEKKQIFINPLLLHVLKKRVVSSDVLFKGEGVNQYKVTYHLPYYLQALTSFSIHVSREKRRKEKGLLLKNLFLHAHREGEEVEEWQKAIVDYLNSLVDTHQINSLLVQPPSVIAYTLMKAISRVETIPLFARNNIEDLFTFLKFLEHKLELLEIYSLHAFKRLVYIGSFLHNIQISDIDKACSFLHFIGVMPVDVNKGTHSSPYGIIDTDFSITFHPSFSHYKPNNIHYYAQISSFDTAIMYVITKQSACRAFDQNLSVNDIINDITSWSTQISPILTQQLEYIHHEYEQIQIFDGISVCVSDRLEKIIDNYEPLQTYIVQKIAKKVYLFKRDDERKWREELVKIGVATLPSTITQIDSPSDEESDNMFTIKVEIDSDSELDERFLYHKNDLVIENKVDFMNQDLKSEVSSRFPIGTERDELLAKIDQKIIITSSQIKIPAKRNAHISASGFDFNKKLLVIKTAMEHKSLLLDIRCLNDDGELDSMIGHPVAYTGGDNNGSVIIKTVPEEKEIAIPIQKIFLIKTIKRSVFFKV